MYYASLDEIYENDYFGSPFNEVDDTFCASKEETPNTKVEQVVPEQIKENAVNVTREPVLFKRPCYFKNSSGGYCTYHKSVDNGNHILILIIIFLLMIIFLK